MITTAQILTATDQRIIELGVAAAKRIVGGKSSEKETEVLLKLVILKKAYYGDISITEKQAILYCLLQVSEKFILPSIQNSGGLAINVSPPVGKSYYIGTGTDITDYWGTGADISSYLK